MYLHELIIQEIELLIAEGEPFSAFDVTQGVREIYPEDIEDIVDCPKFTTKDGDVLYNIEHSRVKSLVHLYLKNYNPNKVQFAHGPKYIIYTPVVEDLTKGVTITSPPWSVISSPISISDDQNITPLPHITYPRVSPNTTVAPQPVTTTTTLKKTDQELVDAAKKILKHLSGY